MKELLNKKAITSLYQNKKLHLTLVFKLSSSNCMYFTFTRANLINSPIARFQSAQCSIQVVLVKRNILPSSKYCSCQVFIYLTRYLFVFSPIEKPEFCLGIAYDYGPLWNIRWRPSGAWDASSTQVCLNCETFAL